MMGMSSVEWSRYMHDVIGLEGNGILSAGAAGMRVVAIPNTRYPPGEEALAAADVEIRSITELTPEVVEEGASGR
jgi:beta-phosphoglucomutase-like phosphatase (HAD superfamily)